MQRIPLKLAEAGMILAKPIMRDGGLVLAGENLVLTEQIIQRLKHSGVKGLTVKGKPFPSMESCEVDLVAMRGRLQYLFRKYQQNPLMWTLRNMLDQYLEKANARQEEILQQEKLERINPQVTEQN